MERNLRGQRIRTEIESKKRLGRSSTGVGRAAVEEKNLVVLNGDASVLVANGNGSGTSRDVGRRRVHVCKRGKKRGLGGEEGRKEEVEVAA